MHIQIHIHICMCVVTIPVPLFPIKNQTGGFSFLVGPGTDALPHEGPGHLYEVLLETPAA